VRVLHVSTSACAGGAELQLARLLPLLKARGIDLGFAYLKDKVGDSPSLVETFGRNAQVFPLHGDSPWDVAHVKRLHAVRSGFRADLVHSHLPRADFATAVTHAYRKGPWLASVHGLYSNQWSGKKMLPLCRWAWNRADRVIAISSAVREWLSRMGVRNDLIGVHPYGISLDAFQPKQRSSSGEDIAPIIGSIGRMDPVKGFESLIRALPIVRAQLPRARLRIAGHNAMGHQSSLEALAREVGVADHVEFVGFRRDVAAFLAECDIFALASRSEGFGQVVLEAMAAEIPVVVSDIPAMHEIITHNEDGIIVSPATPDAFARELVAIARDVIARDRMVARAKQKVQKRFGLDVVADNLVREYEHVLATHRKDR
jgi:glycosyltransferase involved in cell wall biosynthesis